MEQDDLTWCFFSAREHTTHHDGAGARCNRFSHIAAVAHATVGNKGDARALEGCGNVINRGNLGDTNTSDDSRGANTARADANLHGICTSLCQRQRRCTGCNVPPNHLNVWVVLLHPTNPLNHALAVTMRGVDHDRVNACGSQCGHALFGTLAHTHCGADAQFARFIARRVWKVQLLGNIFHGDEPAQFKRIVNDQQPLKLVLVE